jgi:hypothetical protein
LLDIYTNINLILPLKYKAGIKLQIQVKISFRPEHIRYYETDRNEKR